MPSLGEVAHLFKAGETFSYVGTTYTITGFSPDGGFSAHWSHRVGGPLPLPTDAVVAAFVASYEGTPRRVECTDPLEESDEPLIADPPILSPRPSVTLPTSPRHRARRPTRRNPRTPTVAP